MSGVCVYPWVTILAYHFSVSSICYSAYNCCHTSSSTSRETDITVAGVLHVNCCSDANMGGAHFAIYIYIYIYIIPLAKYSRLRSGKRKGQDLLYRPTYSDVCHRALLKCEHVFCTHR